MVRSFLLSVAAAAAASASAALLPSPPPPPTGPVRPFPVLSTANCSIVYELGCAATQWLCPELTFVDREQDLRYVSATVLFVPDPLFNASVDTLDVNPDPDLAGGGPSTQLPTFPETAPCPGLTVTPLTGNSTAFPGRFGLWITGPAVPAVYERCMRRVFYNFNGPADLQFPQAGRVVTVTFAIQPLPIGGLIEPPAPGSVFSGNATARFVLLGEPFAQQCTRTTGLFFRTSRPGTPRYSPAAAGAAGGTGTCKPGLLLDPTFELVPPAFVTPTEPYVVLARVRFNTRFAGYNPNQDRLWIAPPPDCACNATFLQPCPGLLIQPDLTTFNFGLNISRFASTADYTACLQRAYYYNLAAFPGTPSPWDVAAAALIAAGGGSPSLLPPPVGPYDPALRSVEFEAQSVQRGSTSTSVGLGFPLDVLPASAGAVGGNCNAGGVGADNANADAGVAPGDATGEVGAPDSGSNSATPTPDSPTDAVSANSARNVHAGVVVALAAAVAVVLHLL